MSFERFDDKGSLVPVNFNNCLQPARPIAVHELPHSLRVNGVTSLRVLDTIGQAKENIQTTKD